MRPARLVRLIFRVFLLICTLSLSVVSILGGLSAINILMTPGNVNVDLSSITIDVNFSHPDDSYVNIPFTITNDGYFDLTDISVFLSINLDYNSTPSLIKNIYNDNKTFDDIKKTETLNGNYNATGLQLPTESFIPNSIILNFTLNAWYSLKLLQIEVVIINKEIPISIP